MLCQHLKVAMTDASYGQQSLFPASDTCIGSKCRALHGQACSVRREVPTPLRGSRGHVVSSTPTPSSARIPTTSSVSCTCVTPLVHWQIFVLFLFFSLFFFSWISIRTLYLEAKQIKSVETLKRLTPTFVFTHSPPPLRRTYRGPVHVWKPRM